MSATSLAAVTSRVAPVLHDPGGADTFVADGSSVVTGG
jgi:hypothetical protein